MQEPTLTVVSPCCYKDERQIQPFLKSAEKCGVPVRLYGLGQEDGDWISIKINKLTKCLEAIDSELILYTDAKDVIWLKGLDSVRKAYYAYESPIWLCSAEQYCYPCPGPMWFGKYLNAGGYMGNKAYILERLLWMRANSAELIDGDNSLQGNDQGWMQKAWSKGKIRLVLDSSSMIWTTTSGGNPPNLNACLLHLNGQTGDPEKWYREIYG